VLRTTSATYTLTGKLATSTDANGNTTRYAYDTVDRVGQVTDAAGRATAFTYDPLSRPYQQRNQQRGFGCIAGPYWNRHERSSGRSRCIICA